MSLRKDFAQNYSVLANYVYGKSIDIATENQLQDEPQDYLNRPSTARSATTSPPRWRSRSWRSRRTLGCSFEEFSILHTEHFAKSQYYSILAGSDINGDAFPFNDRLAASAATPIVALRITIRMFGCKNCLTCTEGIQLNLQMKISKASAMGSECARWRAGAMEEAFLRQRCRRAYGDGITSPANPTFGTPTYAGAARQFQFSAKLMF